MSAAHTAGQILFQNSLADIVRQLRNNKNREKEMIDAQLADIKSELSSSAQNVKVTAVVKLSYFSMLGYNGDYGAFNIIEVMADPLFQHKRVGYVAAAVTFHENTPVLPLITALLKRDLMSPNQYEVGLALYCISCVCNPDLAKDLVSDVVSLLSHQRAYVRKKAILCLYKIFMQFPEALRPTYPKLKEKIEDGTDKSDNDPAVRGAVVNVLCEMARRNPQNFLNLVPPFYNLLSSVHNNWTLIKVVKVFGYFAPHESRLGKKLVEPITNLINTSPAKSVQYECIWAVANGMSKVSALTRLAVDKMKIFAEDHDQNLKYLGLDAMTRVMKDNPKILADQRDTILSCLDDPDTTIGMKALDLLVGMTSKKNLVSTVNSMFDRAVRDPPDEDWSNSVIEAIVATSAYDDYDRVQDFEWYTGVLLDLSQIHLSHFKHGQLLEHEFVTIMTRVHAVRQMGVESLAALLSSSDILSCNAERSSQWCVLKAAAFVCGEYPYWIPNKRIISSDLLNERISHLPADLQVVCVSAIAKIHSYMVHPCPRHTERVEGEEECEEPEDPTCVEELTAIINPKVTEDDEDLSGLPLYCHSVFPDVQERAQFVQYLISVKPGSAHLFFDAPLEAVAEGAQEAVELPKGLNLDCPFSDMPSLMADSDDGASDFDDESTDSSDREAMFEEQKRRDKMRRNEVDWAYLKDDTKPQKQEELPPMEKLETLSGSPKPHRTSGGKAHTISKVVAKPSTYSSPTTSKGREPSPVEDQATLLFKNINLTGKLGADEVLPEVKPYKKWEPSASPGKEEEKGSPSRLSIPEPSGITIVDNDEMTIVFNVQECKAKKDSFTVKFSSSLTSNESKHSIYAPKISVAEGQEAIISNGQDPKVSSIQLCDRLKAGVNVTNDIIFSFSTFPDLSAPIVLTLNHMRDKKPHQAECYLQLTICHFMKAPSTVEPKEFNSTILDSLKEASCLSAALPIHKKKPQVVADQICDHLNLTTVDILEDCVSLYGRVVARKSNVGQQHVSVLLVADPKSTHKHCSGFTVYVKAHHNEVANQIIQEIAGILA